MSEPKFTPGPWVAENHKGDWWVFGEGGEVATVIPWSTDMDQADAHLIAAAPDMYEALKQVSERLRNCASNIEEEYPIWAGDLRKMADNADAALAKAEGKT